MKDKDYEKVNKIKREIVHNGTLLNKLNREEELSVRYYEDFKKEFIKIVENKIRDLKDEFSTI